MLAVCAAVPGKWLHRHHLTINTCMQRAGLSKGEHREYRRLFCCGWSLLPQGQAFRHKNFTAIGQCAAVAISPIIPRIEYQQVFLPYFVVQSMHFH